MPQTYLIKLARRVGQTSRVVKVLPPTLKDATARVKEADAKVQFSTLNPQLYTLASLTSRIKLREYSPPPGPQPATLYIDPPTLTPKPHTLT